MDQLKKLVQSTVSGSLDNRGSGLQSGEPIVTISQTNGARDSSSFQTSESEILFQFLPTEKSKRSFIIF